MAARSALLRPTMSRELPILTSACMIARSGPGILIISSAPNAFFRKSINLAVPLTFRNGTV